MTEIAYTEMGAGYPVVLLHGFCENKSMWETLQTELSADYRVICPDIPGFGDSPALKEVSMESAAAALYDWLKAKDIFECIFIGHSLGGYITLAIEEAYPNFLKAYGLFHSSALADAPEKKEARDKTIASVKQYGKEAFLKTFIPGLYNPLRIEEYGEFLHHSERMGKKTSAESIMSYLAAMRDRSERMYLLKQKSKPVLFIAGAQDAAVPLEKSLQHQPFIDKKDFHLLQEAGHMGFYECPQESLKIIRSFLVDALA
ncbi:alpha/beta hydrolase [Cytophagales bacterium LB-30]|uniref:Alpha/beta hydrolase n=1 Tax=Shiella aurantiaca TaxID=3058365 RepID=A0ABT8F2B3_9BACT|nr:alpha/beta hydrolase [Shiella aurantiaca]MDN4164494.1 alpha/beta hydrolase [Shiella aurantiaca]